MNINHLPHKYSITKLLSTTTLLSAWLHPIPTCTYNAGRKCWDTYQNTSEQSPPPLPPPQAMLGFDDQTHIYTRKTIYLQL